MTDSLINFLFPYFLFSVFGLIGFFLTFNIVRAHKYDRIAFRIRPSPIDSKDYATSYAIFGIIFNFLYAFFWYMHPKPWGYLLAGLWIGFQIAFFYWYWHTKEDPLGDFEFKSYVKKNEI